MPQGPLKSTPILIDETTAKWLLFAVQCKTCLQNDTSFLGSYFIFRHLTVCVNSPGRLWPFIQLSGFGVKLYFYLSHRYRRRISSCDSQSSFGARIPDRALRASYDTPGTAAFAAPHSPVLPRAVPRVRAFAASTRFCGYWRNERQRVSGPRAGKQALSRSTKLWA